jgi:hypothetical protein
VNIATGNDSYEAWREGIHDDLVLSVALACWFAEQFKPTPAIAPISLTKASFWRNASMARHYGNGYGEGPSAMDAAAMAGRALLNNEGW